MTAPVAVCSAVAGTEVGGASVPVRIHMAM